ncbi:MAG: hypothetical protein SNF33_05950 [Candidatus Algichlamydia australiensis]|nr:hypothetical protein [Chlamydiales bacterium]
MSEQVIRSEQPLHLFVGPIFVAIAEAIALGKGATVAPFLLWLAPIGLIATGIWRLKGALLISGMLLAFPLLHQFSLFSFGWALSVSLALLVSALLMEEDTPLEVFPVSNKEEDYDEVKEKLSSFKKEKEKMELLVQASDEEARKAFFQTKKLEEKLQTLLSEKAKTVPHDGVHHLLEEKEQEIDRLQKEVASLEHELVLKSASESRDPSL